jgi:hypothetical protein
MFEEYEFMGLAFEFRSTCGTAVGSTNTALGTVIMATEYDALDPSFTSKQQMEAYEGAISTVPYGNTCHFVECAPRKNPLETMYVRSGAIPTGADLHLYDQGNFQIATVGMQAANVIGELWVTYHVKFRKPSLPTPSGGELLYARFQGVINTCTAANLLGVTATTALCRVSPSTLEALVVSSNVLTLPTQGTFLVAVAATDGATSLAGPLSVASVGSNVGLVSSRWNGGSTHIRTSWTTNLSTSMFIVSVLGNGTTSANQITFAAPLLMAAGNTDIYISEIPYLGVDDDESFVGEHKGEVDPYPFNISEADLALRVRQLIAQMAKDKEIEPPPLASSSTAGWFGSR